MAKNKDWFWMDLLTFAGRIRGYRMDPEAMADGPERIAVLAALEDAAVGFRTPIEDLYFISEVELLSPAGVVLETQRSLVLQRHGVIGSFTSLDIPES